MRKEFEVARLLMIGAARRGEIDPARGFAWAKRIYPLRPDYLEEAFKDDFSVSRDQTEAVLKAIEAGYRAEKLIPFYDLEEPIGSKPHGLERMQIVAVCRLAYLDHCFDDTVWKALTVPGSGPIESQGLAEPFNAEDDLFY